jgi:hypothetical protein
VILYFVDKKKRKFVTFLTQKLGNFKNISFFGFSSLNLTKKISLSWGVENSQKKFYKNQNMKVKKKF